MTPPRRCAAAVALRVLLPLVLPCGAFGLVTARALKGRCELMVTTLDGKRDGDKFTYSSKTRGFDLRDDDETEAAYLRDVEKTPNKDEFVGTIITKEDYAKFLLADDRSIVFFIHGFNVQSGGTLESTLEMQQMFNDVIRDEPKYKQKKPVLVVPVDWPCGNRFGILRDYWADRQAAKTAARVIEQIFTDVPSRLKKFRRETSLSVVAHSMGNRVLRTVGKSLAPPEDWDESVVTDPNVKILTAAPKELSAWEDVLDNVFLVAADVPDIVMDEPRSVKEKYTAIESGMASMAVLTKRLHVLHASNDLALVGSTAQRLLIGRWNRSQRLGGAGPNMPYWDKIDAELKERVIVKDCTEYESRSFGKHGYQALKESVQHYLDYMP